MDAWINPLTADYAPNGMGDLLRDPAEGLANAAYLRLATPLGSWFGDVTLGSRLHELQREKDVARVELLAKQYAIDALNPLLTDGRVSRLGVDVQRQSGRLALRIELVDAKGNSSSFSTFVKVA